MSEIRFQVQGSADSPYDVTFVNRGNGNLSAYCTCPAGENGQYCKHRFAILNGEIKAIVSGNEHEVSLVVSWLAGSDIESALKDVAAAELELERAKKEVSRVKKLLAEAMRN